MNLSFKQFLIEADYKKKITLEAAEEIIFGPECSNFIGASAERPIVRGIKGGMPSTAYAFQGDAGERKSRYTTNHYTVILDELLPKAGYPARSKSLICATLSNIRHAGQYGEIYAMIPYNDVDIGICPDGDIFLSKVDLFGITAPINEWNEIFNKSNISDSSFTTIAKQISTQLSIFSDDLTPLQDEAKDWVTKNYPDGIDQEQVIKLLTEAYTEPFELGSSNDALEFTPYMHEVWVGGKMIAVSINDYRRMLKKRNMELKK